MNNENQKFKPLIIYPKNNIIIKPFSLEGNIGVELNYHPRFYIDNKLIEGIICFGKEECEICNILELFLLKYKENITLINDIFNKHKIHLGHKRYERIAIPIAIYTVEYSYNFYYGSIVTYTNYAVNFAEYILNNDLLTIGDKKDKRLLKIISQNMRDIQLIDDNFFRFIPDNIRAYESFLNIIENEQTFLTVVLDSMQVYTDIKHSEIYLYYINKLVDIYSSF